MLILYFVVAMLVLVGTGAYMQHEEEHSRRSYDGDTVAIHAGVAIAVFWPFVLALILLFAVFAGPVVLGMFLYKEYNKRNTV